MRRPGVEPAICWPQVQRPNHYTTKAHIHKFVTSTSICYYACLINNETRVTGVTGLTKGLATLSQGNQEPLVAKSRTEDPRWAWGEQVRGIWYFFPSVLWHCWLGDRKGIRPVKSWVLVCWWWRFDWSFARLQLQLSPPLPSSVSSRVVQENGRQTSVVVVVVNNKTASYHHGHSQCKFEYSQGLSKCQQSPIL